MSTLTQDMKDMIAGHQCFIGTVNKDGMRAPKAVTLLRITEIHALKPGPNAGKRIG